MSSNQPVEQDDALSGLDGDDLPTYDNLAETQGPNSRFGRWRGWVEKRAAERYLHEDPEERSRRRERGWGNSFVASLTRNSTQLSQEARSRDLPLPPAYADPEPVASPDPVAPAPAHQGQLLGSSRVSIWNFGSRFLPHAQSQIRTLLPIMQDRFLLLGTNEGLSMLEMYPLATSEIGQTVKGPSEAVQRELWHGEGVYQLALLESIQGAGDVPQGVVMALVGTEPAEGASDKEPFRVVRMYNLSSLASLAAWTASQKENRPIELHQPSGKPPSVGRRHRGGRLLSKSLKALVIDDPSETGSRSAFPSQQSPTSPPRPQPTRADTADSAEWDVVDDLPLRWATDYVPLASSGSKLASQSVNFFELWRNDVYGKGAVMLAIATKCQILLYESPRGERSFRFVKDFYTPLPAKKLAFTYQRIGDTGGEASGSRRGTPGPLDFGGKLCLFVVFEKKAGIIRLSDSTVSEVELYDDYPSSARDMAGSPSSTTFRRSVAGIEHIANALRDHKATWAIPTHLSLPETPESSEPTKERPPQRLVYLLTRGRSTHILPSPLPNPINSVRPYTIVNWETQPTRIITRLLTNLRGEKYLQIVGIGEDGVEVQELPLSFLGKGKGRQRSEPPLRVVEPVGIDAGFLCEGGAWDKQGNDGDASQSSWSSTASSSSVYGEDEPGVPTGIYAWSKKDSQDWRVFWLGLESSAGTAAAPASNYI